MRRPHGRLVIVHKRRWESYPKWCRPWAVVLVARRGGNGVDVDCQISREGTWYGTHWATPMRHGFAPPKGSDLRRDATLHQLTDAQIATLRCVYPDAKGAPIAPVSRFMEVATDGRDVTLCLEVKPDARFELVETYAPIVAHAERTGCRVLIMTIHRHGLTRAARARWERHARRRLAAAHAAGLPTMLLTRGPVSADWWAVLDYVKGPVRHARGRPAHVRRLGPGSPWGESCAPTRASIARAKRAVARAVERSAA